MTAKHRHRDTRALILQAALELLGEYGFAGVTLGSLARKVGMSKSGLFAHFKSIEQLHVALIDHTVNLLRTAVIAPASQVEPGLPQLEVVMARWLEINSNSGGLSRCPLIAGLFEFDDRPGAVREALLAQELVWRGYLGELAGSTISTGYFRSDLDVSQFVSELCGICYSFHVSERFLRTNDALDQAVLAMRSLIRRSR